MGQFTESLTVQILGDSSSLQRELEDAVRAVEGFQGRLSELSRWSEQLGSVMDRLGNTRALTGVNSLLQQIHRQMILINNTTLFLDVGPAMSSLAMLSSALNYVLSQILAVRSLGGGAGVVSSGGGGTTTSGVAEFASGGAVTGEPGVDRVPAMLTAGEFVISKPAVRELGEGFLWALNENPLQSMDQIRNRSIREQMPGSPRNATLTSSPKRGFGHEAGELTTSTVMNVGGLTVNIHQGMDAESVLRNLRLQGVALRNRRG